MDHTDSKFVQAGETPVLPANCTVLYIYQNLQRNSV
ncbi:MAG: hypothetical protein K0Q73_6494, partial [Paenibacillus sp.]|nr:hypothetical protein [Paenibacillus sp.]